LCAASGDNNALIRLFFANSADVLAGLAHRLCGDRAGVDNDDVFVSGLLRGAAHGFGLNHV